MIAPMIRCISNGGYCMPISATISQAQGEAILARTSRRLLPLLFLSYVVAYLDRINVSFAALTMRSDLHLDAAAFGLGSGIFFIGYFFFEVPSNLILAKVGARKWIARIMISWGIFSMAMAATWNQQSFYVLRFALGVAEAGFFPGIILYLTFWFPSHWRGRIVASFMTATALAGLVGSPLSGTVLLLDKRLGLHGWQWLFILEAIPALLLGGLVWLYLPDSPAQARWLDESEKIWLSCRLEEEHRQSQSHSLQHLSEAFTSGRVWCMAAIYFCLIVGMYGLGMWLPQFIKMRSGAGNFQVSLFTIIPYVAAAVGMVFAGRASDRSRKRKPFVIGSFLIGAIGMVLSMQEGNSLIVALCTLSLAALGIWGAFGPFWALASSFLGSTAAAAGIALINSFGNLGGFLGPALMGYSREFGGYAGGLGAIAVILTMGAAMTALVRTGSKS
jgi:ACS family tartrate transporter-like MFS transporter